MDHSPNNSEETTEKQTEPPKIKTAQWTLAFLILALAASGLYHQWVKWHRLDHTAALFIGIPTVFALIIALSPQSKNLTGIILRGIAIALLMSAVFMKEGIICIIMASPLFFGVGVLIAGMIKLIQKMGSDKDKTMYVTGFLSFLFFLSLEGSTEELSFPRDYRISIEKVIHAPAERVRAQLARRPLFDKPLPLYFRLGFPLPVATGGEGLSVGDHRWVRLAGGQAAPGDMVLRIVESAPGQISICC